MGLLYKCSENQEERDYQWSEINASITDKIRLMCIDFLLLYKYSAKNFFIEMHC